MYIWNKHPQKHRLYKIYNVDCCMMVVS